MKRGLGKDEDRAWRSPKKTSMSTTAPDTEPEQNLRTKRKSAIESAENTKRNLEEAADLVTPKRTYFTSRKQCHRSSEESGAFSRKKRVTFAQSPGRGGLVKPERGQRKSAIKCTPKLQYQAAMLIIRQQRRKILQPSTKQVLWMRSIVCGSQKQRDRVS